MDVPATESVTADAARRRLVREAAGIAFVREIDDDRAEVFCESLLLMARQRRGRVDLPITIFINSPGGSVPAGFAMMEMIYLVRSSYGVPVHAHVSGAAYSMGAMLVQAADRRLMGALSTMLLHSSSWALSGEDDTVFEDYQKLSAHYQAVTSQIFARRTGRQDAAWWRRFIYSGRDRFLGPAECLELGLIDAVVDLPEGPLVPEPPARGRTRKGGTRP